MSSNCKPPRERVGSLLKDGKTKKCEIPCNKVKMPDKSKRCTAELGKEEAKKISIDNKIRDDHIKFNKKIREKKERRLKEKKDWDAIIKEYKEIGKQLYYKTKEEQQKVLKPIRQEIEKIKEKRKNLEKKRNKVFNEKTIFTRWYGDFTIYDTKELKLAKIEEEENDLYSKETILEHKEGIILNAIKDTEKRIKATQKAKETRARNKAK